jgi:hypothetical protein
MSTQEQRGGNRPRFRPDPASITAGLVFMTMGLIYLLFSDTRLQSSARWTGSLLVLGLGLAWVIGVLTRRRRR